MAPRTVEPVALPTTAPAAAPAPAPITAPWDLLLQAQPVPRVKRRAVATMPPTIRCLVVVLVLERCPVPERCALMRAFVFSLVMMIVPFLT